MNLDPYNNTHFHINTKSADHHIARKLQLPGKVN